MRNVQPSVVAVLVVAVAVAVGAAVHYRAQGEEYRLRWERAMNAPKGSPAGHAAEPPVVVSVPVPVASTPEATAASGDEVTALRERIAQLEAQAVEQEARLEAMRQAATNRTDRGFGRRGPPDGTRTNSPAMIADFEKRRQEAQQNMQNALARKTEYILKQDTSKLSDRDKAQHDAMVQLLDETWKLTQQMQGDVPWDQRRETMRALRDNMEQLEPMLLAERTREFQSLGTSIGYSDAEAANFAAYLTDVVDLTTVRNLFEGFRPQGGRGPTGNTVNNVGGAGTRPAGGGGTR